MEELKACPLCGEPLTVRKSIVGGEEHYVAYCHCGFEFADDCSIEDFIERCNRRAAPENKPLTITLPCKVGDVVYFACPGCKISDAKVTGFWVSSEWIQLQLSNGSTFTCWDGPNVYFGKSVFLTREAAEQALAARKLEGE